MANSSSEVPSWLGSVSEDAYSSLYQFLQPGYEYKLSPEAAEAAAKIGANALVSSWIVCLTLIGLALLGRAALNRSLKREGTEKYRADAGFSLRNVFEMYVTFIRDLSNGIIAPKDTKKFFWLIAGLFGYILCSNFIGLLPFATSPSQDISNNFALASVVLIMFTFIGFTRQKAGYIKHMAGPVWYLAWLILPIELFSTFIVRPASLSLRLAGNMNGDHTVLGITYSLFEWGLPVAALGLGTFVSFIQAFVFTLLTIVYITLSVEQDDHH